MENGFPEKCDEGGLPELPQGLFKPSAQLCKDLCPVIKPFSPITTATMGKRKGKEKVTQLFSAIQPMNPQNLYKHRCGLDVWAALQSRNLSSKCEGSCHGGKALSSQEEKSGTQQSSRRHLGKDFFTLAVLSPSISSSYPQIKMFLWVGAFKA